MGAWETGRLGDAAVRTAGRAGLSEPRGKTESLRGAVLPSEPGPILTPPPAPARSASTSVTSSIRPAHTAGSSLHVQSELPRSPAIPPQLRPVPRAGTAHFVPPILFPSHRVTIDPTGKKVARRGEKQTQGRCHRVMTLQLLLRERGDDP